MVSLQTSEKLADGWVEKVSEKKSFTTPRPKFTPNTKFPEGTPSLMNFIPIAGFKLAAPGTMKKFTDSLANPN